ncbi:ABC transporter substrate-binding protein [Ensifer sp. YR511]|uniref:ABC transporter substrate-binding protein n=1 Tax=Ensifer sp. YR511 TaxID=1855294 RepID=UPI00088AF9E2|nr:ABC transporter substrate-binding protein [Ensifer sp. YR511]SDN42434.1 peptide/nickel transport system substrate-binding protein [Ensifer sp. YR511]
MQHKSIALIALTLLWLQSAAAFADTPRSVTIVLPDPLASVDACQVQTSTTGRVIKLNVLESLTQVDVANGGVKPRLADEWKPIDSNTWEFKLRRNVKFHDGAEMDAKSVAYSIERVLDPNLGCDAYAFYFANTKVTTEIVDSHTIRIATVPPQPILPTLMEAVSIVSPTTPRKELTRQPIGTGPFRFTSWDPQSEIVLDKFEGYWGEKPAVEKAHYKWRQESLVRAAMVKLGEADIGLNIADQDADDPKTDISFHNSEMLRIQINTDRPPFDDVRVRKALNLALDRASLVGVLINPKATLAAQIVGPSALGFNPEIKPYPFDPDQAQKLLAEAKADGAPVDTTIQMIARANNFPNADEVMEAFVAMWEAVGLKVSVKTLEMAQYRASGKPPFEPNRPATLRFSSHDNATGDAGVSILAKYHSSSFQADVPNTEVDAMIEKALASTGDERRVQFQAILKKVHDEIVPEIWVYDMVSTARVNPRIDYKPNAASGSIIDLSSITFN